VEEWNSVGRNVRTEALIIAHLGAEVAGIVLAVEEFAVALAIRPPVNDVFVAAFIYCHCAWAPCAIGLSPLAALFKEPPDGRTTITREPRT
jgi:hypothetical protein